MSNRLVEKTELRKQIEQALEQAGLGKQFDREIPIVAIKIYRDQITPEKAAE
jgi:hypothetical protein